MSEVILAVISGGVGAAVVSGLFGLWLYKVKRRDAKKDAGDANRKALRYIMLYIIQERCKSHILDGEVTLEDRRMLRHWHDLYHDGLGGNGDADVLMAQVDKLPVRVEE